MENGRLKYLLNRGFWVFVALVILAIVEYLLILVMDSGNLPWMVILNVIDAGLIVYFFMHVAQLWRQED